MTVVIVDDEAMVREWFASSIEKMHPDYQLLGTAHDGPSGLELCQKSSADIAVVDIKMPGMDGIELIKQLVSVCPNTITIVLSSYPDFNYAREALKAGAADYLLKAEITHDSLREVLDQVVATAAVLIEPNPLRSAGSGELSRLLRREFDIPAQSIAVAILIPINQVNIKTEIPAIFSRLAQTVSYTGFCESVGSGVFLGFISPQPAMHRDPQEVAPVFANRLINLLHGFDKEIKINVGVDACAADIPDIWEKLTCAVKAALTAWQSSEIFGIQQLERSSLEEGYIRFMAEVDAAEPVRASHCIVDLLNFAANDPESVVSVLFDLLSLGVPQENPAIIGQTVQSVIDSVTEMGAKESLKRASEEFLKNRTEQLLSSDPHVLAQTEPISRALNYISKHYHKDLSLDEVAQYIGLSSGYLSELFPQVTGSYFLDHLTELRISKAAELLSFTRVPIRRIGELVGYPNPSYFGQVFRRHVGISPGIYRRQNSQR